MFKKFVVGGLICMFSVVATAWQPTKSVEITVPFPPGSGNDVVGRTLAEVVSRNTGVNFVVVNRPGAGGTIGSTHFVNNSKSDGHYINIISVGGIAGIDYSWPSFLSNPPYSIDDFAWATALAQSPLVIIANKNDSASNPKEFMKVLLETDGVTFADNGGAGRLAVESLLLHTNARHINPSIIRPTHRGPLETIADVVGGHVRYGVTPLPISYQHHLSGNLKIIGLIQQSKVSNVEIESFVDVNKDINSNLVWGIALPKGTAPEVLEWYAKHFKDAQNDPKVREIFAKNSYFPVNGLDTPKTFTEHVLSEYERNKEVVQVIIKNMK